MASSSNSPPSDKPRDGHRPRPSLSEFFRVDALEVRRSPSIPVPLPAHKKRSSEWWSEGLVRKSQIRSSGISPSTASPSTNGVAAKVDDTQTVTAKSPVAEPPAASASRDSDSGSPEASAETDTVESSAKRQSVSEEEADIYRTSPGIGAPLSSLASQTTTANADESAVSSTMDLGPNRDSLVPVVAIAPTESHIEVQLAAEQSQLSVEDLSVLPQGRRGLLSGLGAIVAVAGVLLVGWGVIQWSALSDNNLAEQQQTADPPTQDPEKLAERPVADLAVLPPAPVTTQTDKLALLPAAKPSVVPPAVQQNTEKPEPLSAQVSSSPSDMGQHSTDQHREDLSGQTVPQPSAAKQLGNEQTSTKQTRAAASNSSTLNSAVASEAPQESAPQTDVATSEGKAIVAVPLMPKGSSHATFPSLSTSAQRQLNNSRATRSDRDEEISASDNAPSAAFSTE